MTTPNTLPYCRTCNGVATAETIGGWQEVRPREWYCPHHKEKATTPNTTDLAALVAAVRAMHHPYRQAEDIAAQMTGDGPSPSLWEDTCILCQVLMPCPTIAAIDGLEAQRDEAVCLARGVGIAWGAHSDHRHGCGACGKGLKCVDEQALWWSAIEWTKTAVGYPGAVLRAAPASEAS